MLNFQEHEQRLINVLKDFLSEMQTTLEQYGLEVKFDPPHSFPSDDPEKYDSEVTIYIYDTGKFQPEKIGEFFWGTELFLICQGRAYDPLEFKEVLLHQFDYFYKELKKRKIK